MSCLTEASPDILSMITFHMCDGVLPFFYINERGDSSLFKRLRMESDVVPVRAAYRHVQRLRRVCRLFATASWLPSPADVFACVATSFGVWCNIYHSKNDTAIANLIHGKATTTNARRA
jgi:hypothetical protein